ncbi:hypothetical protein KA005_52940, partial [bacterium]|nr:hypothetical protein [bacterium]
SWTTFGTIPKVDIYYSKDDFADLDPVNGVPDNQILIKNNVGSGQEALNWDNDYADTGTFNWKIPDDRSDNVKIRIYDHNDHNVYIEGPTQVGAVDTMKIDYYKIKWDIRDLVTNNPIEGLVVDETSDDPDYSWKATGKASPITHDVPAGFYTTEWTHKEFGPISESYLTGWDEDAEVWRGDKTIYRTMETLVVHIWRAYSEFAYNVEDDRLDITSWLERDGSLVSGALIIDANIYDGIYKIKRKTLLVDETNNKWLFYDDLADSVKLWIGDRLGEVRTMADVITDCGTFTSEMAIPADFGGFFSQAWTPTAYTAGADSYDTLEAGKVYAVVTYMGLSTGATFRTPASFTVTIPKKMADMETTVDSMISTVAWALGDPEGITVPAGQSRLEIILSAQAELITNKMNEQIDVMVGSKTDEEIEELKAGGGMVGIVESTMTSFEDRVDTAIINLETGARESLAASRDMTLAAGLAKEKIEDAAKMTEETAKKYSGELILPRTVLMGDTLNIRYSGLMELDPLPIMDIVDHEAKSIVKGQTLTENSEQKGLYEYDLKIEGDEFTSGKAITIIVIADVADSEKDGVAYKVQNMEIGSVAIESTTLSAIEGLVATVPAIKTAAEEARDLIKNTGIALENALKSGTDIDLMLTYLQETVESLPKLLAQEGPLPEMSKSINDMADRLIKLAGDEGYDMSTLMEKSLSESPTLKEMRLKTDQINAVVVLLRKIFESKFGGEDAPVVSTSLEPGSVVFRVSAANPSATKTQTVPIKIYLPLEVKAEDILDQGGLELDYDLKKAVYYLYKNDLKLTPKQVISFAVEVEDVWMLPEEETSGLKKRTERIIGQLEKTDYATQAKEMADTIYKRLDEIVRSQKDDTVTRNQHIGAYRTNLRVIDKIKEDIERLEKLLTFTGGPPVPEMLEESALKLDAPSTTTTWMIIFIIIIFLAVLGAVFFFTWHRQKHSTESFFTQAQESAFPKTKQAPVEKSESPEEKKEE